MTTDNTAPALDAVLAAFGLKTTQAGALTTFAAFILSSQGAALVGICGVFWGLVIQWYYRRRQDIREELQDLRELEEHEARMRGLE